MTNPFESIDRRLTGIENALQRFKAPPSELSMAPKKPSPVELFRGKIGKQYYFIDDCDTIPFTVLMEDPNQANYHIIRYDIPRYDGTEYDSIRMIEQRGYFLSEEAALKQLIGNMEKHLKDLKQYLTDMGE